MRLSGLSGLKWPKAGCPGTPRGENSTENGMFRQGEPLKRILFQRKSCPNRVFPAFRGEPIRRSPSAENPRRMRGRGREGEKGTFFIWSPPLPALTPYRSMISFSLAAHFSSTLATYLSVSFWTSSVAFLSSSSEMALSFSSFLSWSLASRRTLRTATLASSPDLRASLPSSLRRVFGQRRDGDADDLAVVHRGQAEVGLEDGLFHAGERAAIPGLDGDGAAIRYGDGRELADGRGRAVVINLDVVHKAGGGAGRCGGG